MAEEEGMVKKPAQEKDAKAHEAPKEHRPAQDKDAVKVHKAAEAPKEHKAVHEPKAHEKEMPKEAKAHDKEAPREATKAVAGAVAPKKRPAAAPAKAGAPKPKVVGKADIGIDVRPPAKVCSDRNCPFHGQLPVRGQIFEGVVVSDGMDKSAVIRRERLVFVPKYERFMKRTSRMSVHSPPCIGAAAGDQVTVMECRPLSKTIAFTIVCKRVEARPKTE